MFLRHCVTDFYKPRCHLQQGKNNKNKSVKLGGWRGGGGVSQKIRFSDRLSCFFNKTRSW